MRSSKDCSPMSCCIICMQASHRGPGTYPHKGLEQMECGKVPISVARSGPRFNVENRCCSYLLKAAPFGAGLIGLGCALLSSSSSRLVVSLETWPGRPDPGRTAFLTSNSNVILTVLNTLLSRASLLGSLVMIGALKQNPILLCCLILPQLGIGPLPPREQV